MSRWCTFCFARPMQHATARPPSKTPKAKQSSPRVCTIVVRFNKQTKAMVLLAATAVGVGGYAAYRGGEAAVNAGGRKIQDMKRESRRREEKRGLNDKVRERSSRLQEIQDRRTAAKNGSVTTIGTGSSSTTSLPAAAVEMLEKDRLASIKQRYQEARGGTSTSTSTKKKSILGGLFQKK